MSGDAPDKAWFGKVTWRLQQTDLKAVGFIIMKRGCRAHVWRDLNRKLLYLYPSSRAGRLGCGWGPKLAEAHQTGVQIASPILFHLHFLLAVRLKP